VGKDLEGFEDNLREFKILQEGQTLPSCKNVTHPNRPDCKESGTCLSGFDCYYWDKVCANFFGPLVFKL